MSFNYSGGGRDGNGQYRYGEGAPADLTVGGNLIITNRARMFVYSAATNAIHHHGARVSVGGTLRVATNAVLYLSSHPTNGGSATLEVGSLALAAGGLIRADKGFTGGISPRGNGFGPGGGRDGTYWNPSGAGYGGDGGGTGPSYGSSNAPTLPGSGGQAGGSSAREHYGKIGGGLVRIEAASRIDLAGTISANHPGLTGGTGGGGSGGGVYLRCRIFAGTEGAAILADGGSTYDGGGGGGGRIAVWRVRDESAGTVTTSVTGGTGSNENDGAPGTVVWGWLPDYGTTIILR